LAAWERDTLFPKYELASGISLVEAYGSIKLLDYESLLHVAKEHGPREPGKSLLPQPTALRLTGTQYLVLPDDWKADFAEPVAHDSGDWPADAALWKMRATLPRAWVVHEVTAMSPLARPRNVAAVRERTREVLFSDQKPRDFRRMAVVETDQPRPEWTEVQPSGELTDLMHEEVHIKHYQPQYVAVEASLARPGLLVMSDAWYPGWKAIVTSAGQTHDEPIYRTNRVFRGVWLPAGQHVVEFRYQPASFYRGAAISGLSLCMLVAVGIALTFRRWNQIE
jgi:hypothetical protein